MKKNALIVTLLLVAGICLGQEKGVVLNTTTVGMGSLSAEEKEMSLNAITNTLNAYIENGKFDTSLKISSFYNLFAEDAELLNDLSQNANSPISIDDYFSKARTFEGTSGYIFDLVDPVLKTVYKDKGLLVGKLEASKHITTILDDNANVKNTEITAELSLTFKIDPFEPEYAMINEISGKISGDQTEKETKEEEKVKQDKPKTSVFKLPANNNFAFGLVVGLTSATISDANPAIDIEKSGGRNIGARISYRKYLVRKVDRPRLYLTSSLEYNYYTLNTEISAFNARYQQGNQSILTNLTTDQQVLNGPEDYTDVSLQINNVAEDFQEELTLNSFRLGIGLEYSIFRRSSASGWFLGLNFGSNIILSGAGQTSSSYDFLILPNPDEVHPFPDIEDIPISVLEAGGYIGRSFEGETNINVQNNVSFFLQPSLRYQYAYSRRTGLEIGASYQIGISNHLKAFSTIENRFLDGTSSDRSSSILEDYVGQNGLRNFNFTIAIVYFLDKYNSR